MQLAFLMPNAAERKEIARIRESVVDFRPDQIAHLEHLLRSWRIFGRPDGIALTWRAIKRTLNDRP